MVTIVLLENGVSEGFSPCIWKTLFAKSSPTIRIFSLVVLAQAPSSAFVIR